MIRFGVALNIVLLCVVQTAGAATRNNSMQIKILDSESRSVTIDGSGVPKNCDPLIFDAYCHSSKTVETTNTLVVQEGNEAPFRVACNVESKWSRCVSLPKGQSFEARREKRGILVYYVDDRGKARSQLYTPVAGGAGGTATATGVGTAEAPINPSDVATSRPRETVKCSFSSTPAGAEVTVDGRYVGSTPSVLGLTTGTHVVVISMAGFAKWKRELAVTAGSELTVSAVLEKGQ